MARGDLTDQEWAMIGPPLPPERGHWARPAGDNRLFLNGMLHVPRTGCPWRGMHERYGKWNSVYIRFWRWTERDVRDALLQTLVDLGVADHRQYTLDSTRVRVHSQATGAKEGLIRRLLAGHAAALRAKFTLDATIGDALLVLLALSSPAGKSRTKRPQRSPKNRLVALQGSQPHLGSGPIDLGGRI